MLDSYSHDPWFHYVPFVSTSKQWSAPSAWHRTTSSYPAYDVGYRRGYKSARRRFSRSNANLVAHTMSMSKKLATLERKVDSLIQLLGQSQVSACDESSLKSDVEGKFCAYESKPPACPVPHDFAVGADAMPCDDTLVSPPGLASPDVEFLSSLGDSCVFETTARKEVAPWTPIVPAGMAPTIFFDGDALAPGSSVIFVGLERSSYLNGVTGENKRFDTVSGRYIVNVPFGDSVKVRGTNLKLSALCSRCGVPATTAGCCVCALDGDATLGGESHGNEDADFRALIEDLREGRCSWSEAELIELAREIWDPILATSRIVP